MLKLVFEDNCVVVNDTEEYYFDSIDSLKTVGQLCAFLEGQETFPKDKKVMPFSVKGRKIGSKEAAASTVAFIKIEAAEGCPSSPACAYTMQRQRHRLSLRQRSPSRHPNRRLLWSRLQPLRPS